MAGKVLRDHLNDAARWLSAPPSAKRDWSPFEQKGSSARAADVASVIGIEQFAPRKYAELYGKYRTNPIIRQCTKLCSEAVAKLRPIVKVNGEEGHPIAKAIETWFEKPNPGQDRFAYVSELASYFKLSGNGWVEAVGGATPDYIEHYNLRPERMTVRPGPDGWVAEYVYWSASGRRVGLDPVLDPTVRPGPNDRVWNARYQRQGEGPRSRLLHIKDFATDNDFFGSGALEACEGALDTYENAQDLARATLKNGAVISGMLSFDPSVPSGQSTPTLSPEQKADLRRQMKEKTGAKNAGKYIIADGGLKWIPMGSTLVDLQAEEIRNNAARDICRSFGVPSLMIGIPGDLTFANFEEASRAFFRNTVFSDAERVYGGLAAFWSRLTKVQNIKLEIDEEQVWALAEELERKWNRIESSQILSFEEKRVALGYDEHPDIDDLMQSPTGGFATLAEMVAGDFGLWRPVQSSVVSNEPAPAEETAALPPPA